eukprot:jgi/Chlat1/8793/Chrsp90S00887
MAAAVAVAPATTPATSPCRQASACVGWRELAGRHIAVVHRKSGLGLQRREQRWSLSSMSLGMSPARNAVCAVAAASSYDVVLTREKGKNQALMDALSIHGLQCLEMPLIEHGRGEDRDKLPAALQGAMRTTEEWAWVVLTSPEAVLVFLEGWREAGQPNVRTAVVGEGTGRVLKQAGFPQLEPQFTPSKALGVDLARELPTEGNMRVLYPSSAKAGSDIEAGLKARGFHITRLNTYNTRSVSHIDASLKTAAASAPVAAFGSPTAVRAWIELLGKDKQVAAACIGSTSAKAARNAGLELVFHPQNPGIEGWTESVLQAIDATKQAAL